MLDITNIPDEDFNRILDEIIVEETSISEALQKYYNSLGPIEKILQSNIIKPEPASVEELLQMARKRPDVVVAKFAEGDELIYLKAMKAEASHMYDINGVSSIIVDQEKATRRTIFHEWMHRYFKRKTGGVVLPNEDEIIEKILDKYKTFLKLEEP